VITRPSPFRADLLRERVALVTGGATGLGLEIARVLGGHGARVAICSRKMTCDGDPLSSDAR
jgi:short chain dehydrogenase